MTQQWAESVFTNPEPGKITHMGKQGEQKQIFNTWYKKSKGIPMHWWLIFYNAFHSIFFFAKLTKWKTNNNNTPLLSTLKH